MKRILLISVILAATLFSACAAPAITPEPTNTTTPTSTPTTAEYDYPLSSHKGSSDDPIPLGFILPHDEYTIVVASVSKAGGWVDIYELNGAYLEENDFKVYYEGKYYDYDYIHVWTTVQDYCNIELRFDSEVIKKGALLVWEEEYHFILE